MKTFHATAVYPNFNQNKVTSDWNNKSIPLQQFNIDHGLKCVTLFAVAGLVPLVSLVLLFAALLRNVILWQDRSSINSNTLISRVFFVAPSFQPSFHYPKNMNW